MMKRLLRSFRLSWISLLTGAHIYGRETGPASRRNIMLSCFLFNIITNLINGTYLSGFMLSIGGGADYINMVVLLFSICNMAQLFSPLVLERLKKRKGLCMALRCTAHAVNLLAVPLIALAGLPTPLLLGMTGALLCLAQLFTAFSNPGIQVWHLACLPKETRLGFYSLLNAGNSLLTHLSLFGASLLADAMVRWLGAGVALPALRMLAVGLALLDILCLSRIHEYPAEAAGGSISPRGLAADLRQNAGYFRVIAVSVLWNFSAGIPSQYFNTYMLDDLRMSYTFLNSVNLYTILAVLLFTRPWKRFIARHTLRGGLFAGVALNGLHAVALFFTISASVWVYPVALIYSFNFMVGNNICLAMVPFIDLPEKNRTVYLTLYNTISALANTLGIWLGRLLYRALEAAPVAGPAGGAIAPARVLVLLMGIAMVASGFAMNRLLKKAAAGA